MTYKQFVKLCQECAEIVKNNSPIDTGNLRYNAIRLKYESPTKIIITVDEDIAPYMVYTNEPWLSPKWNGKQNPNQYWWNNVIDKVVQHVKDFTNGRQKGKRKGK